MALPLPAEHRGALEPYLARYATQAPGFAWARPGNLHLTLRFLGTVPDAVVPELGRRLAAVDFERFDIHLGGVSTFGGSRRARVIWLGLAAGAERCLELAALVERACREAGLPAAERPFRPHLTLARARGRGGTPMVDLPPLPEIPAWVADRFVLFESHLGRPAPVYERVQDFPLRAR